MLDLKDKKILVTGGGGFLGTQIVRTLTARGVPETNIFVPTVPEFDLRRRADCERAVKGNDLMIHLAANVGGIGYNQANPGALFYDNIVMGMHVLEAAHKAGMEKSLILGTICAYPKFTPVPFREETLWNGYPEETNAPYGLAKKALLVGAQAYRSEFNMNVIYLLPVNLYGPGDTFDPARAHVIPDLIRKMHAAKIKGESYVEVWGTGRPTREFLYVEDAAEGIVRALESYDKGDPVNLGAGREISIKDLVAAIARLMDFTGEIRWDRTKPDGQPRRMLDISRAKAEFDFEAKTDFEEGLKKTIAWYVKNIAK